MKLASFVRGDRPTYGIVSGEALIDAGSRFAPDLPDLLAVLAAGRLDDLRALANAEPDVRVDQVRLLKPIPRPGKTVCVGVNYLGRNEEYRDNAERAAYPSLFLRVPESLVAHGEALTKPPESDQYDYEGEVALVIGRAGRRIAAADALTHVAGYTACNEGTVRDWCRHGKFNVTAGKNFARTGSIGPYLVTADELGSGPFRVMTRVNGDLRQDDTTDRMIYPIPLLISYISTFCTLEPGDVIVTGTPTGAGARFDPPRFLRHGDVVDVEVPGVGILSNAVVDEVAVSPRGEAVPAAV